ncbi:trehalose-phosphatase [Azohydromonas caseinilytica]|uniref:Trehalose 6-phosphate phosphatase n=1 Tax=Azohydromonas caseinilytica TaxID=2728836 RepID=A0A848F1G6_9BURK|nr:trehalose-phosphatase [Azohydromonas caseinilytica]NML13917.1 trehalose-phosphatase [Azohydromonas caseinilytica]
MLEPPLPGPGCALFLDFDGTLADIAAHPQAVRVASSVTPSLAALAAALGGALAVVSGRPIAEIDHFLAPLQLPAAGVHGAERRRADGAWQRLAAPALDTVLGSLQALCAAHPGLLLEEKSGAIALHYRQAPLLEGQCLAAMTQALQQLPDMALMRGKQVIELKPRAAGKDAAVRAFLAETPFQGRQPWFFGDDVTDEAAFEAVQALDGVAVKVGEGITRARHRVADPAAVHRWMEEALRKLAAAAETAKPTR